MSKVIWKPGTMVYPVPVVMVSCKDKNENMNIITIAWTGTICSTPAMTYISMRKDRHSYDMIKESGEFVINLTTEKLAKITDYCGVKSGKDVDKFKEMGLTPMNSSEVDAPLILESPVNIECRVKDIIELGSHDMFLAEVVAVQVDEKYLDKDGRFELEKADLIAYSHGHYYSIGEQLGKFGYSVMKPKTKKKIEQAKQKKKE